MLETRTPGPGSQLPKEAISCVFPRVKAPASSSLSPGASSHCLADAREPRRLPSTPGRALTSLQVTAQSSPRSGREDARLRARSKHALPNWTPSSPPSIQGPDPLPGGRSARHHRRRRGAKRGVWGPASSPEDFPGEEEVVLPRQPPRLSGSRRGCGKEEGQSRGGGEDEGGGVHRCAQIREAFLASQWQPAARWLRRWKRRGCRGGSDRLSSAGGGRALLRGCSRPGREAPRRAGAGVPSLAPSPSPPAGALRTHGCRSPPLSALSPPSGTSSGLACLSIAFWPLLILLLRVRAGACAVVC